MSHVPPELNSLLDESTFDKSRVYQLDKSSYGLVHDLFKQVELMVRAGYYRNGFHTCCAEVSFPKGQIDKIRSLQLD